MPDAVVPGQVGNRVKVTFPVRSNILEYIGQNVNLPTKMGHREIYISELNTTYFHLQILP